LLGARSGVQYIPTEQIRQGDRAAELGEMMGHLRHWLESRGIAARVLFTVVLGVVIAGLGVGVSAGVVAQSSPPVSDATLTVLPHTNLVDLQQVTLVGESFTPNVSIATLQCDTHAVDQSGCDLSTLIYTNSDATGAFNFKRAVRRLMNINGSTVDCASSPCAMAAANIGNTSEHAGELISFNPNIPPVQPKVIVTPNKKLIDHQLVRVTGQGFLPGTQVTVNQCPSGTEYFCGYGISRSATIGKNGKFTITNFAVQRILNVYGNSGPDTVDCASSPGECEIAAVNGEFGGQPVTAPLSFNPAVPPAVAGLSVTPSTGLGDLRQVTVIGTGFTPGSQVELEECGSSVQNPACDYTDAQSATPGFHGEFLVTFVVRRNVPLTLGIGSGGSASFDCAIQIGACSIQAFSISSNSVSVPLTFDKHKPPVVPTIAASPSTGLTDNELIDVTLTGFAPRSSIEIVECNRKAISDANLGECDFSTTAVASTPAGGGNPSTQIAVHRAIAGSAGLVDCSAHPGNCVLAAYGYGFYAGYGSVVTSPAVGGLVNSASTSSALLRAEAITPAALNHAPKAGPKAGSPAKLPGVAIVKLSFAKAP
jgi:hypothetical protein